MHLKYFKEKEKDKNSDYSIEDSPKTSKEKSIQKNFANNIIEDYHTFNNKSNKIPPTSSELDILAKKQLYSNDSVYKNYLKTRVRVFVPAKESESILKEIDEEEEKSEIENLINNKNIQNKGNINNNFNRIYEEERLKHINKEKGEKEKIEENKDLSKSERNINMNEFGKKK